MNNIIFGDFVKKKKKKKKSNFLLIKKIENCKFIDKFSMINVLFKINKDCLILYFYCTFLAVNKDLYL